MTTPSSARMMYAIRCRVSGSRTRAEIDDFLIEHPVTRKLVAFTTLDSPWRHSPALLPQAEAQARADELRRTSGDPWQIELAPNACPSCAREIGPDRIDFCYPRGLKSGPWRAGCNEHDGGCGFEIEGSSYDDVVTKWNEMQAEELETA